MKNSGFATSLLQWHDKHGRHDLPWQSDMSAYRIWISEIMLQQTQVVTVISYYQRFMKSFPNIESLANADLDQVLHLWTGLGYYARARNLHKTAKLVMSDFAGQFPNDLENVISLPGIGRSTASAILALSDNQHHAILDGNVKRVLTRYFTIEGWYGKKAVEQELWLRAEELTPKQKTAQYTQAIMDLGATICTRTQAKCTECPLHKHCQAYASNTVKQYPTPKPKKTIPVKSTIMLLLRDSDNHVFLQQRPPTGIWGGLWCLPEADCTATKSALLEWSNEQLHFNLENIIFDTPVRHTFSHFHLDITPAYASVINESARIMEQADTVWYNTAKPDARGLAAPVKKLLEAHNDIITGVTS